MNHFSEPDAMDSLVKLFPLCKRLLLHTPWHMREITGTQRLVLLTMAAYGTLTMTQLAETIFCSKEQATRAVAPLVEQGYLERIYDKENRTRVWVQLTQEGRGLLHREYDAVSDSIHDALGGLSPTEQAHLREALHTVSRLLGQAQAALEHPAEPHAPCTDKVL